MSQDRFNRTHGVFIMRLFLELLAHDFIDRSDLAWLRTRVPVSDTATSLTIVKLPQVTAIDKSDVSPVLKQTLTFTLTCYSDTLLAS